MACEEGGLKAQLHLAQGSALGNDDTPPSPNALKGQLHSAQGSTLGSKGNTLGNGCTPPSLAPCKGSYINLKREVITK